MEDIQAEATTKYEARVEAMRHMVKEAERKAEAEEMKRKADAAEREAEAAKLQADGGSGTDEWLDWQGLQVRDRFGEWAFEEKESDVVVGSAWQPKRERILKR
jgi:hypothetical protein